MKPCTKAAYDARLLRVLLHIQRHLDRPLGLAELAAVAAFSPFHFARIFRALTGETVGEHVRRLKLERAAGQLLRTRRTVTAIALDAGFDTPEAFTRSFKGLFGSPPSAFRKTGGRSRPAGAQSDLDGMLGGSAACEGGDTKTLDVAVRAFPRYDFAFLRHVGPYDEVGPVFDRVLAIAAGQGLLGPAAKVMMLSYDDPTVTETGKLRSDAGVTLADPSMDTGPLTKGEIAGGLYAVKLHTGPYRGLRGAYDWLFGVWLPASGYEADDRPCAEVFLNGPAGAAPEALLTEIRMPVRRP